MYVAYSNNPTVQERDEVRENLRESEYFRTLLRKPCMIVHAPKQSIWRHMNISVVLGLLVLYAAHAHGKEIRTYANSAKLSEVREQRVLILDYLVVARKDVLSELSLFAIDRLVNDTLAIFTPVMVSDEMNRKLAPNSLERVELVDAKDFEEEYKKLSKLVSDTRAKYDIRTKENLSKNIHESLLSYRESINKVCEAANVEAVLVGSNLYSYKFGAFSNTVTLSVLLIGKDGSKLWAFDGSMDRDDTFDDIGGTSKSLLFGIFFAPPPTDVTLRNSKKLIQIESIFIRKLLHEDMNGIQHKDEIDEYLPEETINFYSRMVD